VEDRVPASTNHKFLRGERLRCQEIPRWPPAAETQGPHGTGTASRSRRSSVVTLVDLHYGGALRAARNWVWVGTYSGFRVSSLTPAWCRRGGSAGGDGQLPRAPALALPRDHRTLLAKSTLRSAPTGSTPSYNAWSPVPDVAHPRVCSVQPRRTEPGLAGHGRLRGCASQSAGAQRNLRPGARSWAGPGLLGGGGDGDWAARLGRGGPSDPPPS
jgi:hypothetical protein